MNRLKNMIRKNIVENTDCIYQNAWEYKLHACKMVEGTTKKMRYSFWIETPEGEFSEAVTVSLAKCMNKTAFEWLYDYEGGFIRDDVLAVRLAFKRYDTYAKAHSVFDRVDIDLVYQELCEIAESKLEDEVITIRDGYYNIAVKEFKKLVAELDCDYKALEIKKKFKELGILRVNSGRAYDYTMTDKDGSPYKVISIKKIEEEEVMAV